MKFHPVRNAFLNFLFYYAVIFAVVQAANGAGSGKPYNVLVIIIDDFDAALTTVNNKAAPVQTPNMERLSRQGTWFTRAYCDAPACCPSRTALLTGVQTSKSGVYFNSQAYKRAGTFISDVTTLPGQFLAHGYLTAGFGKIAHNRYLEDDTGDYTPGYYKMFNKDVTFTETQLFKQVPAADAVPGPTASVKRIGKLPDDWDRDDPKKLQQDTEQANRTIELLGKTRNEPFFVVCGFWRPHVQWIVPKRYFDRYPLDKIELPPGYQANDLDDVPGPGRWLATHRGEHAAIVDAGFWKRSLQAYYASVTYVDEQVGRVLDALEKSPDRDRTIVVFFGDNGYHIGEKDHWTKFALWEKACHVPFSIFVPGFPNQKVATPVSLIDLYPTLNDLCKLKAPGHALDGIDLTPVLEGRSLERGAPVISTYGRGSHSLRDERYRYIRYRNGDEELYDLDMDPYEWTNLASDPELSGVKQGFQKWLPTENAPEVKMVPGGEEEVNNFPEEAFRK